ncbi:uncharacterized protein [Anabrus simplex]|uniref:uncharacterized protein n=1 Tax=Anabrus simplex TaxID=316456 RepID=UPI0034DD547A
MTMDMNVQQRGSSSLLGSGTNVSSPSATSSSSTTPPATPSYSPSLPTTATTQPRTVKRSFDVAFLMAPDENLAKKQQLRLVAANSLLKRANSSSPEHLQPSSPCPRLPISKPVLFEHSVPGLLLPPSPTTQEDLVEKVSKPHHNISKSPELHLINMRLRSSFPDDIIEKSSRAHTIVPHELDSLSNTAMIRSAFTKVTTSTKFDASSLLSMPVPPSPSSVSSLSGGLSPDHMTYQGSMSPPVIVEGPTSSPLPTHFMPTATKSLPGTMPLLSPQSHIAASSTVASKSLPTSYTSAAFLLQQEHNGKHIKTSNGLCNNGNMHSSSSVVNAANSGTSFRSDIDNYLMKASISSGGHQLYGGVSEKDLLSGFPGSSSMSSGATTAAKLRPSSSMLYSHPESVAAYSTLAAAAYPFAANFSTDLLVTRAPPPTGLLAATNPAAAAAMVSASLLPPSFAALSLPAQNVCAKCNINFRMTSDLVYHMRSQHKSDSQATTDPLRRRREQDKLKCPVCNESFRERHHLTRHMTAHQDKEGDMEDSEEPVVRRRIGVTASGISHSDTK